MVQSGSFVNTARANAWYCPVILSTLRMLRCARAVGPREPEPIKCRSLSEGESMLVLV